MKAAPQPTTTSGMSTPEMMLVVCALLALLSMFGVGCLYWKRGSNRSATIMHIRNCQQAMRGHQGMNNLNAGAPFTKHDLATYLPFPNDIRTIEGMIRFDPGDEKVKPCVSTAVNGDHLWLKVKAPKTTDYVGRYGFKDIREVDGW